MGWVELKRAISDDKSNTANWSDDTSEVEVTQRKGFMCNLTAKGRLNMEPDKVFDILTSPDNYKYFSGIKVLSSSSQLRICMIASSSALVLTHWLQHGQSHPCRLRQRAGLFTFE